MKARKPIDMPLRKRITCSIREASDATGLSRRKIEDLISRGVLKSAKVDKKRLVDVPSLLGLVNAAA